MCQPIDYRGSFLGWDISKFPFRNVVVVDDDDGDDEDSNYLTLV